MLRPDGHPLLAALLDLAMAPLAPVREKLIPLARGRVLEIGMGTGLNLPLYPDGVAITGVEPDPHMRRRTIARAEALGLDVRVVAGSAEQLEFEDGAFDTVVATWVLCTIPDPEAAAAQMRRVLAPDGLLIFAEHTVAPCGLTAGVQRGLTPLWRRVAGGCHLDRDAVDILQSAGFALETRAPRHPCWTIAPTFRGTGQPAGESGKASADVAAE